MKKTNGRLLATTSLFSLVAIAATGCSGDSADGQSAAGETEDEVITMRLAHVQPTTSVEHETLEEMAGTLEERTNGRFILEIYPSGQLGSTTDILEQAASGEDMISYTDASYLSTLGAEDLGILGGPFLFENTEQAQTFSESPVFTDLTDQLAEEADLRVLALNWFDGPRHLIGQEAYPEPADLEGVKVRTPPVDTWTETFELLGAVPTTVENTETYSGLQQGVVDAAESPVNGIAAQGWQEVAPHITETTHFQLFLGFAMGEDTFRSLPDDIQEILLDEFQNAGAQAAEAHAASVEENVAAFEAEGVEFHEADIAAYQDATEAFYDDYPEGFLEEVRSAAEGN